MPNDREYVYNGQIKNTSLMATMFDFRMLFGLQI